MRTGGGASGRVLDRAELVVDDEEEDEDAVGPPFRTTRERGQGKGMAMTDYNSVVRGNKSIRGVLYYVVCSNTCSKASSEVKYEQAALVSSPPSKCNRTE